MSEDDLRLNERFTDQMAAYIARREQQRLLRAELAAARKIGKTRRHAFRLRESTADPTNTEDR